MLQHKLRAVLVSHGAGSHFCLWLKQRCQISAKDNKRPGENIWLKQVLHDSKWNLCSPVVLYLSQVRKNIISRGAIQFTLRTTSSHVMMNVSRNKPAQSVDLHRTKPCIHSSCEEVCARHSNFVGTSAMRERPHGFKHLPSFSLYQSAETVTVSWQETDENGGNQV